MAITAIRRIASLERMRASVNGNPRYRVLFEDGTMSTTSPDASVAWGLENPEYKNVDVKVTYERGEIIYVNPIKE